MTNYDISWYIMKYYDIFVLRIMTSWWDIMTFWWWHPDDGTFFSDWEDTKRQKMLRTSDLELLWWWWTGCWLQLWRCWGYRWCWKPFWIWGSFSVPGKHSFSHNENIARWKTTAVRMPRKFSIFCWNLDLQLGLGHWCLAANLKISIYNEEMFS